MGIQGLMRVISDNAPGSIKENVIKNFFGRKICVDASMSLYQFLIAVRPDDTNTFTLTNDVGETTSHLIGFFYRTIRMVESGIKPIYVFDGKPPVLKSGELAKRTKKRKEAEEAVTEAKEEGDMEALAKVNKRTVRVTPQHNEETKKLLKLMGIPYVEAPCEAEAQCAEMVKSGLCYGAGSEDMDSLTLGVPLLLRHLNYSESRGLPILEIRLEKVLEGLNMDMDQFIDLCILLGCDYCDSIRGIGPKRAIQLIEKYKNIETILENLDTEKYKVPDNFPYVEIRELFKHPEVIKSSDLDVKWNEPDEAGLIEFLVQQKGFSEERVKRGVEKLNKSRTTAVQGRITSFFGAAPSKKPEPASSKKTDAKSSAAKKTSSFFTDSMQSKTKSNQKVEISQQTEQKPIVEHKLEEPKSDVKDSSSGASSSSAATETTTSSMESKSTNQDEVDMKAEISQPEESKPKAIHPFFQPKKPAASKQPADKQDVEMSSVRSPVKVSRKNRIEED